MKKLLIALSLLSGTAFAEGYVGMNYTEHVDGDRQAGVVYWLSADEPLYKKMQIGLSAYSQYESREYHANYNKVGIYKDYKFVRFEALYIYDGAAALFQPLNYHHKIGVGVSGRLWK